MRHPIPMFDFRVSFQNFLKKENLEFIQELKKLNFQIDYIREEFSENWKFSFYTRDYSVPDNFKFYSEIRNVRHSNYSPYDLSVSDEERRRDMKRVLEGPKKTEFKFYFYKDKKVLDKECRIFLEEDSLENGHYDVLFSRVQENIKFLNTALEMEKFYTQKKMNKSLIEKLVNEINERRNAVSKIYLLD